MLVAGFTGAALATMLPCGVFGLPAQRRSKLSKKVQTVPTTDYRPCTKSHLVVVGSDNGRGIGSGSGRGW